MFTRLACWGVPDRRRRSWEGVGVVGVSVRSVEYDQRFRDAAFAWLQERGQVPVVGRAELMGFVFECERIGLIDQSRGIRRLAVLRGALSFMTTYSATEASAPYDDAPGPDGFLRYKYRGTDPKQGDNCAIREAMDERLPMIWFYGVWPGTYLATFPVFAIAEERAQHQFVVSADVPANLAEPLAGPAIEREYRLVHTYQRVSPAGVPSAGDAGL
jgi:putative restriction endonuclease